MNVESKDGRFSQMWRRSSLRRRVVLCLTCISFGSCTAGVLIEDSTNIIPDRVSASTPRPLATPESVYSPGQPTSTIVPTPEDL